MARFMFLVRLDVFMNLCGAVALVVMMGARSVLLVSVMVWVPFRAKKY